MTLHARTPVTAPTPRVGAVTAGSGFTASWPSTAAWGAGLIAAALGAGAIVGAESGVAARAFGVILVTLGVLSLVWGGWNLAQARLMAPAVALAGSMAGVLGLFGLLLVAPARTSVFAVAAGTFLLVVVGSTCAAAVRRGVEHPRDAGTLRGILGLLVAATLLAVIVTPALGATQDAVLLRDDGTVPVVTHDGH